MRRVHAATSALAVALAFGAGPAAAVDLTTKTPNIESPRTTPVGELHFPFTHRFGLAGSKVVNSPTLSLSTGLGPSTSAGLRWASNSALASKDPGSLLHQAIDPVNEFELGLKQGLARQSDAWPVDLTGVLTYNTAANSGDAALVLAHAIGPLTLLANAKGFTSGYGVGGLTVAGGGGIRWRLTRHRNLRHIVSPPPEAPAVSPESQAPASESASAAESASATEPAAATAAHGRPGVSSRKAGSLSRVTVPWDRP